MRVVAVFGGGGAKAIAHVGAWKAIRDAGGEVTHVVATSMGAVIGAALAAGAAPDEGAVAARSLSPQGVGAPAVPGLPKGVVSSPILQGEGVPATDPPSG